jgi:hypothetical protein
VWRWQRRFVEAGVEGLLRDASRKPGKASLGESLVRRVVTLTCAEPSACAASVCRTPSGRRRSHPAIASQQKTEHRIW